MLNRIGFENAGSYNFSYRTAVAQLGPFQNPSIPNGQQLNQPVQTTYPSNPAVTGDTQFFETRTGAKTDKTPSTSGSKECQACKDRKYQDGSNDPGVSMKTPTNVSPENAASAVTSHEFEHVFREQAAANREGREVVSQSVQIHTAVCPECGRVYVSGGKTTTVTKEKDDFQSDNQKRLGKLLDAYV